MTRRWIGCLAKTVAGAMMALMLAGCASAPPKAHYALGPKEVEQYSGYDPKMALVLAKASDAVYADDPLLCERFRQLNELEGEWSCDWSDKSEARSDRQAPFRAAVFRKKGDLILAFRGTIPHVDSIATDAHYLPAPLFDDSGMTVHGGFLLSWLHLRRWVEAKVAEEMPRAGRLWITGHSQGGAQALLAAYFLSGSGARVPAEHIGGVYLFAAPRVGERGFASAIDTSPVGKRVFRIENDLDLVPLLPEGREFAAAGRCVFLDSADIARPCPNRTLRSQLLNPDTWRSIAAVEAHGIASYIAALGHACNAPAERWKAGPWPEECLPAEVRPQPFPYASAQAP